MLVPNSTSAETSAENKESNWRRVQLQVGELVSLSDYFHSSLCTFVKRRCFEFEDEFLLVPGDLNDEVGGVRVVHIKGDLNSDIIISDHSELIIGGDVAEHSTIYSEGISRVFVGGSFYGKLESISSTRIFVMGDFKGALYTGTPSTHLSVKRDFEGTIQPLTGDGALLTVDVKGHADGKVIKAFYESDYTSINGYFGSSNMADGVFRLNRHNLTIGKSQ